MKLAQRIFLLLLLIVGLAGCTLDLPAPTSASVKRFEKGSDVQAWSLTESQQDALTSWFKEHQSGWSKSYVSYVPNIEVWVKHVSGDQSSINIWSNIIIVNSGSSQLVQKFEASEIQSLLSAVGALGR